MTSIELPRRELLAGGAALTLFGSSLAKGQAGAKFRIAIPADFERLAQKAEWQKLGEDVEIVYFDRAFESEQATVEALKEFDALVLMRERTPLPGRVLAQLPRLKLIAFTGAFNHTLDHQAAQARGIVVCNGSFSFPPAQGRGTVAELAVALMLACAYRVPQATVAIRQGEWGLVSRPLGGKTLGIAGYGRIGRQVGILGLALGMKILGFGRSLTDEQAREDGVASVDLDRLMRESDVVSVHLPLTEETRGMIGAGRIEAMKPGAYLINTARAHVVDEQSLIEALRSGRIGMGGFDVFYEEPLPAGHPFVSMSNVVMTPHMGYVTEEALLGMYNAQVDVIDSFRRGVVIHRYVPEQ